MRTNPENMDMVTLVCQESRDTAAMTSLEAKNDKRMKVVTLPSSRVYDGWADHSQARRWPFCFAKDVFPLSRTRARSHFTHVNI